MQFMQDNAPAHRAFVTRDWLRTNNVQVFGPWPAKSPAMNPIENLWAQVQVKSTEQTTYAKKQRRTVASCSGHME